ncbi:IS21 family transposase [Psychromonas sp. MME2]|uniref:IS21 family transposase n=1 Tax=unclassified Psychromonas TaxID=2614957 RepID=UPI00339BD1A5
MAANRLTMRKIREVLRLRFEANLSVRQINASTKISVGAIQKLLTKANELTLSWPLSNELDDTELARLFYPKADTQTARRFQIPDWPEIHKELKAKGMTKLLLWEEYCQQYPNRCLSYSQFCDRYLNWAKKQKRSMRQTHKAGDKLFVDYAGQTMSVISPTTGEVRAAQIFVAVLGASNYTYAEATWSQSLPDWLASHVRTFEFIGGTPVMVVPDNLRSGVSKACRYEPELNPSYQQLAAHYSVAVMPARPYKPKDKSKAEVGVQIIERWILARLRHQIFFSLAELNRCIASLLTEVNLKPFKQLPGNRLQWFEQLDRPLLKALPVHPYQYVDIKSAKVNIDYHIQYDQHLYSVPHHLVGEKVELHVGDKLVQIYFKTHLLASHVRKHHPGTTTEPGHMPERHAKHQQWSPGRLKNWAKDIGPEVLRWVSDQLEHKEHPEQAYRVCLGLLNLTRSYPAERLNNACAIANQKALVKLKNIKAILLSNQDKLPREETAKAITLPQDHENVRGPQSFH